MKKVRFAEEQMVAIRREADWTPVAEVASKHKVSEQTIYVWRRRFGKLAPAAREAARRMAARATRPARIVPRLGRPPRQQATNARFADIVDHIERVLRHARTVESQAESAVQLRFAAVSHRANDIMCVLMLITAIFTPLMLVTGLFGMNFEIMPWLHRSDGFRLSIAATVAIVVGMLACFRHKRWL